MDSYLIVFCLGVCLILGVMAQTLTLLVYTLAVDRPHVPYERREGYYEQYQTHLQRTQFIQFVLRSAVLVFAITMMVALLRKEYYANVIFMALALAAAVSYTFSTTVTERYKTGHPRYTYPKEAERAR